MPEFPLLSCLTAKVKAALGPVMSTLSLSLSLCICMCFNQLSEHISCQSTFIKSSVLQLVRQMILFSCSRAGGAYISCCTPAAQAAVVHVTLSLHKDPEASLHSQSHHSTPSQKPATVLFSGAALANCPHVLGTAKVGTACGETLYCLTSDISCTILSAAPTHMLPCFHCWV